MGELTEKYNFLIQMRMIGLIFWRFTQGRWI